MTKKAMRRSEIILNSITCRSFSLSEREAQMGLMNINRQPQKRADHCACRKGQEKEKAYDESGNG